MSIIITDCPPGTFFTSESCSKCAKGEFQQHWNERTCVKCPVGYSTMENGSIDDTYCIGRYSYVDFVFSVMKPLFKTIYLYIAYHNIQSSAADAKAAQTRLQCSLGWSHRYKNYAVVIAI